MSAEGEYSALITHRTALKRHFARPDVRFKVARKIVERPGDHGIPPADVVIDPIIMLIGAVESAGTSAFRLVRRLQEELGVNAGCGASTISFGLPNRPVLNAAFLVMAIASGMRSAITNPIGTEIKQMILRRT